MGRPTGWEEGIALPVYAATAAGISGRGTAAPVDLRRSFDRLAAEVRERLHNDPLSGHVYVFRNKRGDRVKLLYWDEGGYVIVYKRLEMGVFPWPAAGTGQASVALRAAELAMLLDGIDWSKAQRGRHHHRPATAATPA